MKRTNGKGRPRQRTARPTLESLPGMIAFYADSLEHSMLEGFAYVARGRPHHVCAFGTIETMVHGRADRPVVFDSRQVLGASERVVRDGHPERCELTLALRNGGTVRIGLDAPRERVEEVLRKARG
jgi:hypothetical protein